MLCCYRCNLFLCFPLSLFQVSRYLSYQPFYSVTDVIAMDCEMVGVGQGNKSALGRVSLVFSFSLFSMLILLICLLNDFHL